MNASLIVYNYIMDELQLATDVSNEKCGVTS